jgi:20S proteasome alpha/beta subunit
MLKILLFLFLSLCNAYLESTIQFNPDGRILQTEYAKEAAKKGSPIIAIRCEDGLLIASFIEEKYSSILCKELPQKIFLVRNNAHPNMKIAKSSSSMSSPSFIFVCVSGWMSDAPYIVDIAKSTSLDYLSKFNSEITVSNIASKLSKIVHSNTRSGGSRPIGLSLLVIGYDRTQGFQIYKIDPEGSLQPFYAAAIGEKDMEIEEVFSSSDLFIRNSHTSKPLPTISQAKIFVKKCFKLWRPKDGMNPSSNEEKSTFVVDVIEAILSHDSKEADIKRIIYGVDDILKIDE